MRRAKTLLNALTDADSSLGHRIAKGAIWSALGGVSIQALKMAAMVLAARLLGQISYGELGIILSTAGMLGLLAGMGLGLTATKYVAEYRVKDPERAGRTLLTCMLVGLISGAATAVAFAYFADDLGRSILHAPQIVPELRLSSALLFFYTLNGVLSGGLAGIESFKMIAKVNLCQGIVGIPLIGVGIHFWDLNGAIVGLTATALIGGAITLWALKLELEAASIPLVALPKWPDLRVLWEFSLPSMMATAIASPAMWAANALLVNRPNGFEQMALFSAANQWRLALMFIPLFVGQAITPIVANALSDGDRASARTAFYTSLAINGLASAFPALIIWIFASDIMKLYGSGFSQGSPILCLCAATAILQAVAASAASTVAGSGRMWWGFLMNLAWACVFLVCVKAFIFREAFGVALSYLVAYTFHGVWVTAFIYFAVIRNPHPRGVSSNPIQSQDRNTSPNSEADRIS